MDRRKFLINNSILASGLATFPISGFSFNE